MGVRILRECVVALLFAAVISTVTTSGETLSRYITDETSTLNTAELAAIEGKLSDFDRASSTQIIVLVVSSVGSGSVEEASQRVAEENGIGQKGKNNGVLLFIAKNDRQVRIEVGYGLEGVLTDVISGQIIRQVIVPRFRAGEFYQGIDEAVDAIIAVTKGEYTADPSNRDARGNGFVPLIFIILAFFFLNTLARRRRSIGLAAPFMFFPGGGRGSGGWSGGGGGFSGGGGSFGGGGASGGW